MYRVRVKYETYVKPTKTTQETNNGIKEERRVTEKTQEKKKKKQGIELSWVSTPKGVNIHIPHNKESTITLFFCSTIHESRCFLSNPKPTFPKTKNKQKETKQENDNHQQTN